VYSPLNDGKERKGERRKKEKWQKKIGKSSECHYSGARLKSSENAPLNKKI
jgi:hypothetical protein